MIFLASSFRRPPAFFALIAQPCIRAGMVGSRELAKESCSYENFQSSQKQYCKRAKDDWALEDSNLRPFSISSLRYQLLLANFKQSFLKNHLIDRSQIWRGNVKKHVEQHGGVHTSDSFRVFTRTDQKPSFATFKAEFRPLEVVLRVRHPSSFL